MAEFVYNNVKNASINYMLFKLKNSYYLYISYKDIDFWSQLKLANKLANKLRELISICRKNL